MKKREGKSKKTADLRKRAEEKLKSEAAVSPKTSAEDIALKDSEERYHLFIKNLQGIAFQAKLDFTPIFIHGAVEAITGYSEQAFLDGNPRWHQIVHPHDLPLLSESMKKLRSIRNYSDEREYRIVRQDTQIRWIHEFIQNVADDSGKVALIQGAVYDITDRKQAQEALQISESNYRTIFDSANDAIFIHDIESGRILSVSQKACEMFGYTKDEFERLAVEDISAGIAPYVQQEALRRIERAFQEGPQLFEWICKDKAGNNFWVEVNLKRAAIEGSDCILAIVRDITERKKAEDALKLHETRLQALLELNKMADTPKEQILDFVREEMIRITQSEFAFIGFMSENESVMTMDNWSKHTMTQCAVIDHPMHFPITEAGLWGQAVRQRKPVVVNDYSGCHEGKKGHPKGHIPLKRLLSVPVFDGEQIVAVAAVANKAIDYDESDIRALTSMMNDMWQLVQRRDAQDAMQENENRFRILFENAGEALFLIDTESGRFVDVNRRACDALGYTLEELHSLAVPDIDSCYPREKFEQLVGVLGEDESVTIESVHKKKDGTTFPVEIRTGFIAMRGKKRLLSMVRNISERKQAEETLKRQQYYLAKAQEIGSIGTWDLDIKRNKLIWTDENYRIFGVPIGTELTYDIFLNCVHPDDREYVDKKWKAAFNNKPYDIEHRLLVDGAVRWVREKAEVEFDEKGNCVRGIGFTQDITERKNMERRQHLVGEILERINQKSEQLDLVRNIIALLKEYTGFAAIGIRLREGDDFPFYQVNGFPHDFVKAENHLCIRDESGKQIYDEQGEPVLECMCGMVISARTDPVFPFFTEGGSFWTSSTTELLASTTPEAFDFPVRGRCNRAGFESVALVPLRSGDQVVGLLQLNDTKPGRLTPQIIAFFEGIGTSIGIALERIRAAQEIRNLARFPSENPFPILRIASNGAILYANQAGSKLLKEWGTELGRSAPDNWRQYVLRVLESGSSKNVETICCGDRVLSLVMAPVVDAGYVNIYGFDVTERKKAEEELRQYRRHLEELVDDRTAELTEANVQLRQEIEQRKRLEKQLLNISEREQRRIGQELHDSIGQQLTGIAFMTKVLQQKLEARELEEVDNVVQIAELVNQTTEQTRRLAKGLHPVDLDAQSLMSALQELAANTGQLFGISCTFKCDKPLPVDDPAVAVNLYRIAQEAVTNAIKHGKAKNICIALASKADNFVLTVENDGLDFAENCRQNGTGMGLHIMEHRVDMIGGSLDVCKGDKGGAIVVCTFPNTQQ